MARKRLSWDDMLPIERAASAHPATPDEGAAHPAHTPEPDAHAHENGDTSSWAEDVHQPPYPDSAHPAYPDEGAAHPAVSKAAARELLASVERKAAKCVRLAEATLGPKADPMMIEAQAVGFMELSDSVLDSTLARLASDDEDEDDADADADASDDEDDVTEAAKKKAKARKAKKAEDDEDDEDEDEVEETASKKAFDVEATLRRLLAEEGMDDEDEVEETASKKAKARKKAEDDEDEDDEAEIKAMLDDLAGTYHEAPEVAGWGDNVAFDADLDIDMAGGLDPMFSDDPLDLNDDDEALMAQIFAEQVANNGFGRSASDDEDEDDMGEADEAASKKASRTRVASQRPQPRKPSNGVTRLASVQRVASAGDAEIAELEKLWPTAPDVSGVFK